MALKQIDIGSGYAVTIDSRDIPLSSYIRQEVWDWSEKQGIQLEGHQYNINGLDVWRVRDDRQRMLFLLKWK